MSELTSSSSITPSITEEINSNSNADSLTSEENKVESKPICDGSASLTSLKQLTKPLIKPALPPKPNL